MRFFRSMTMIAKLSTLAIGMFSILLVVLFGLFIHNQNQKAVEGAVDKARSICLTAESARDQMDEKWQKGLFSKEQMLALSKHYRETGDETSKDKLLGMVPVVSAWEVAQRKAEEGGYELRVPKFYPRNPVNEPDEIEAQVLKAFQEDPDLSSMPHPETHVVDTENNTVRYFRAIRLSESCMMCHGDPADSQKYWGNSDGKDALGYDMENWKVGEVHGAFEIVQKLDEAQAQTMATVGKAGGIALFGTILCAVILATGIRRIVSKPLKMMVDSLTQGSLQVRDASGELASAAQSLASSTSQQSASLEETASALNQVEAMITQNAASTKEADTIMQSSVRSMHDGAEKVSAMSGAMTEMTESSSQIRDIIKLIQDIAFQTNLLALNAAVEAARAGDAGRGFAVVAEEVRSLAQRSSEAARRTTDLVENSVRTISNGSTILDELKSSFNDAEQHLKRIAEHMGQISRASTEQSQGINQVTQSMNHIDALNQSNASASEEAASASEELASQSALLMDLIAELRSWGEQSSNTSGNHGDNGFLEQYDHPKAPLAARPGKSDSTPDPESVLPF